jgi:hypothetical protein
VKKFNYIILGKKNLEEIWVCAACKKMHTDEIIMGKWKLIEMSDNAGIPCCVCEGDQTVGNA